MITECPNQKQSLAAAAGRNRLAVSTAELRVVKETSCSEGVSWR